MPYRMCDIYVKKNWSLLGARRQNLSRLRVEKLGCAGSRQVIPAVSLSQRFDGQLSPRLYQVKQVTACHWHTFVLLLLGSLQPILT
jgi:hypothetical protein